MSTQTSPRRPASSRPPARSSRPQGGGGGGRPAASGAGIDPFRVIRKRLLLIIASVFVGAGLGIGGFFVARKFYSLYTERVVFQVNPGVAGANDVGTLSAIRDEEIARIANTQLQLMLSRDVVRDTLGKRDVKGTKWWRDNHGRDARLELAVDQFTDQLKSGMVPSSNLFQVSWSNSDAESVPVVLNALADSYMEAQRDAADARFAGNERQFSQRLDEINQQLSNVSSRIESLIGEGGMTSSDDARYSETAAAARAIVEDIQTALQAQTLAESNYARAQGKIDGRFAFSEEDIILAESDPSVAQLTREIEVGRLELAQLRKTYTDEDNKQVQAADQRIRSAQAVKEDRIREIIRRNLEARALNERAISENQAQLIEQLERDLAEKRQDLQQLTVKNQKLREYEQESENLRQDQQEYQSLIREVKLMKARQDAQRTQIFLTAKRPRDRSFPKLIVFLPLGVLLVSGATVGLVFLRELVDQRVRGASDLEVIPGARVLGVVPDVTEDPSRLKDPQLAVFHHPHTVLAESNRQVLTPVLSALEQFDQQTLVIAGAMPHAGTTTLIGNLAAGLALSGRRVVVIDANFRRPGVATMFGSEEHEPGLGDVLHGDLSLASAVHEHESGVHWIGAGTSASHVVERLGTERFDSILGELRARYDFVIVDVAPAVVAGDAVTVATRVDAAILIVRSDETERGLVGRVARQLDQATRLLGFILNRPKGTPGGYFRKNFRTMAAYTRRVVKDGGKSKAQAKADAKAEAKRRAKADAEAAADARAKAKADRKADRKVDKKADPKSDRQADGPDAAGKVPKADASASDPEMLLDGGDKPASGAAETMKKLAEEAARLADAAPPPSAPASPPRATPKPSASGSSGSSGSSTPRSGKSIGPADLASPTGPVRGTPTSKPPSGPPANTGGGAGGSAPKKPNVPKSPKNGGSRGRGPSKDPGGTGLPWDGPDTPPKKPKG